jgi:hypothetical protein
MLAAIREANVISKDLTSIYAQALYRGIWLSIYWINPKERGESPFIYPSARLLLVVTQFSQSLHDLGLRNRAANNKYEY